MGLANKILIFMKKTKHGWKKFIGISRKFGIGKEGIGSIKVLGIEEERERARLS